jgi:hypothetical protein
MCSKLPVAKSFISNYQRNFTPSKNNEGKTTELKVEPIVPNNEGKTTELKQQEPVVPNNEGKTAELKVEPIIPNNEGKTIELKQQEPVLNSNVQKNEKITTELKADLHTKINESYQKLLELETNSLLLEKEKNASLHKKLLEFQKHNSELKIENKVLSDNCTFYLGEICNKDVRIKQLETINSRRADTHSELVENVEKFMRSVTKKRKL